MTEEEVVSRPPPLSSSSVVVVVVEQIIQELIHHYSQPIHYQNDNDAWDHYQMWLCDDYNEDDNDAWDHYQMWLCDDDNEEDNNNRGGCSTTTIPPMILAWRDRILQQQQQVDYYSDGCCCCCCCCDDHNNKNDSCDCCCCCCGNDDVGATRKRTVRLLLSTYVQQLSPLVQRCCCSTKMSSSIPVTILVHYELLLQSLRQYHQQSTIPSSLSLSAAVGSKSCTATVPSTPPGVHHHSAVVSSFPFNAAATTATDESMVSPQQSQQLPLRTTATTSTTTTCGCGSEDKSTTRPIVVVVDDSSQTHPHPQQQQQQPSRHCRYKTTHPTTTMHNVVSTLLSDIVALQQQHRQTVNNTTTTFHEEQQQQDDSFDSSGTKRILQLEVVLWRILHVTLDEVANITQPPQLPMSTTTAPNNSSSSTAVVNNMGKDEPEPDADDNDDDNVLESKKAILCKCICVLLGTPTTDTSLSRRRREINHNPVSSSSSSCCPPQPRGYCDIDPRIVPALLDVSQYHPFHPFSMNNESTIATKTTTETLLDTSAIMASSASQLTMPRRLLEWVDLEPPLSTIASTESTTTPAVDATAPLSSSSPNIQQRIHIHRARVVNSIWSGLLQLTHTYGIDNIPAVATSTSQLHLDDLSLASTNTVAQSKTTQQQRLTQCQVLNALGWAECAKSIRMYFFGYNEAATAIVVKTRQRLHLGRTITEPKPNLTNVPSYQANPHRLWAALELVALLPYIDASIMADLLSVVYELLNSPHDEYIRWGAVKLYRLLQCTKGSNNNDVNTSNIPSHHHYADAWWRSETGMIAFENLSCMLHQVIQTCRMGPTLAVLGAAQRILLLEQRRRQQQQQQLDPTTPMVQTTSSLAKALHQWLLILDRNSRHYTKNHLVWGLLYGGIVPLLYDATVILQNDGDDSCVELGRLGLSALLSILGGDASYDDGSIDVFTNTNDDVLHSTISTDESKRKSVHLYFAVQVAALTALSSLLVAAHPIMPRHAGKILCELITYMQNTKRKGNAHQPESHGVILHTLALHAAAVAVIVCGDTAAVNLDRLLQCTDYEDCIANSVLEIRHIALQITS